ncbi:DUF1360 domain-containing protein [Streptomyces sp. PLAI1-29]|uniref:DUF1360 domain-containing protein n=1 Tax=Streptomyces zingiberis TaxID=2053010 RepID=A0ABX1BR60_9ACTN|nr:DUF1360 domain-containing protein [Streptomyces zingiberis]
MDFPVFLLALGAVARVTRFVNLDALAGPLRAWFIRRGGPESKLVTLVECPWCLSVWVAAAVVPLAFLYGHTLWFQIPATALTVSYLYGAAARFVET